jgi:hypothetical protein
MDIPMAAGGQDLLVLRPRELRDAEQIICSVEGGKERSGAIKKPRFGGAGEQN